MTQREAKNDSRSSQWLSPAFIFQLIVALILSGAAYGAMNLSLATQKTAIEAQAQQFKDLGMIYMRIDVYEARHKALEDKIDTMAKSIEEIKIFLMGKPTRRN